MRRFAAIDDHMTAAVGNELVTNCYLTKGEQRGKYTWFPRVQTYPAHPIGASACETADQLGPAVEGWQRFFRRLGGQADDDPGNPLVAITLQPVDGLADP